MGWSKTRHTTPAAAGGVLAAGKTCAVPELDRESPVFVGR